MSREIDREYTTFITLFVEAKENDCVAEEKETMTIVKHLMSHMIYFTNLLPGNLTPQKLTNLDNDLEETRFFVENYFDKILQTLIENLKLILNQNSRELNDLVKKYFAVDGGDPTILNLVIFALLEGVKNTKSPSSSMDFLLEIIKEVIKSDLISSAIIQSCLKEDFSNTAEFQEDLQLILTLPDVISNQTKGKFCKFFVEKFPDIVFFHVGNVIRILGTANLDTEKINVASLAFFLSKVLLRFSHTQGLTVLTEAFEFWSTNYSEVQKIIVKVLSELNKSAVEQIAFRTLNVCQSPRTVRNVLGDLVMTNSKFKHAICSKFILQNYFDQVKYPTFLYNLIGYLYLNSEKLVLDLMVRVLNLWCDTIAINHTPLVQHFYLTKVIVISGRFIENSVRGEDKDEIRRLLFEGVPVHLQSSDEEIRALGMITAEILIPRFTNVKTEVDLKFDYGIFNSQTLQSVNELRSVDVKIIESSIGDGDCKLLSLIKDDRDIVEIKFVDPGANEQDEKLVFEKSKEKTGLREDEEISPDEDIDSDDDLVPYDTSNDVKVSKIPPPLYLRDLIDVLADRQNVEKFRVGFEVAQNLINDQLANDDPEIGIDLLRLLISIDDSYGIENFLTSKFNCCLDIICVYPIQCSKYLCEEFNSTFNKYSIADRLFMLDLLSTSARKLSGLTEDKLVEESTLSKGREKEYEKIVRERILSNTRHFFSKRKPPVRKKNNFHEVAGHFFFPLVKNFGMTQLTFSKAEKIDPIQSEVLILTRFLNAISVIVYCSRNAPICMKIVREVTELVWTVRYHKENKVRLAVMSCVASVFLAAPKSILITDLFERIIDYRDWLIYSASKDPDVNCRTFATQLCLLIKDFEVD